MTASHRYQRSMDLGTVALSDAWARRRLTLCVRRHDTLSLQARLLVEALEAGHSG